MLVIPVLKPHTLPCFAIFHMFEVTQILPLTLTLTVKLSSRMELTKINCKHYTHLCW